MSFGKTWIMLLLLSLACLLTSMYIVFFHESAVRRPEDDTPIIIDYPDSENERPELEDMQQNNNYIETGYSPNDNIYVREIPVPLDADMQDHLAQFRERAKLLNREFPHSFTISMKGTEKAIALTFDDGPDNSSTPKIVEILNNYNIHGTFFMLGQQMTGNADIVQLIADGGHAIANHSWSHLRPTDASVDQLMDEADKTQQEISKYSTGTKLFRPPYGLVDRTQMPALIEAGYNVVCWSVDSMDWYFDDPKLIVECVVKNAHPGAIVLMHCAGGRDNRNATIEALPEIIETLKKEGYSFVRLGE